MWPGIRRQSASRKRSKKSEPESATFVEKTIQPVANKIFKKMSSTSYKRGVRKMSQERRDNDVAILNELIEQAQSLRDLIEAAKVRQGRGRHCPGNKHNTAQFPA